jgi:hypothetical protein
MGKPIFSESEKVARLYVQGKFIGKENGVNVEYAFMDSITLQADITSDLRFPSKITARTSLIFNMNTEMNLLPGKERKHQAPSPRILPAAARVTRGPARQRIGA